MKLPSDPSAEVVFPRGTVIEQDWSVVVRGLARALDGLPSQSPSAAAQAAMRTLRVLIAADEEYRRVGDWEEHARSLAEGASHILELQFGIRLEPVGYASWVSSDRPQAPDQHLQSLVRQVHPDSVDIVLGIIGQREPDPAAGPSELVGTSEPFGRTVLIAWEAFDVRASALAEVFAGAAVAQEVMHLFGVPRTGRRERLRANGWIGVPLELGGGREIIDLTRDRAFQDAQPVDVPVDSLDPIYRRVGGEGLRILDKLRDEEATPPAADVDATEP